MRCTGCALDLLADVALSTNCKHHGATRGGPDVVSGQRPWGQCRHHAGGGHCGTECHFDEDYGA